MLTKAGLRQPSQENNEYSGHGYDLERLQTRLLLLLK